MRPRDVSWLVLVVGLASAQEPLAPPTFPAAVEQVVVDAVVLDERGAAVSGLSRDDFVLAEDGAPQALASFEAVEAVPPPSGDGQATTTGTEVASNTEPPGPALTRTLAIVFDDLGLTGPQGERARTAVADFVKAHTRAGERLVLLATSGRGRWEARSADEAEDLLAVLGHLRGQASPGGQAELMSDAEAYRIHAQHDRRTTVQVADRYRGAGFGVGQETLRMVGADARVTYGRGASRARQALAVLERTALSLADSRGRKALVLVSPGFFQESSRPEYGRVLDACRRANVAVYFLNAAGLDAGPQAPGAALLSPLPSFDPDRPSSEPGADQEAYASAFQGRDTDATAGADRVASDTGGFAVRNTNDLASGLRRIAEDSRAYYLLGYVSTHTSRDDRFRKIEVRLAPRADARRRGWRVRARPGYYVLAEAASRAARTAEGELGRALDSPVDRSDLPVRLSAYVLEDSKKKRGTVRCRLLAEVEARALSTKQQEGRAVARLDAAFETLARDTGRVERAGQRAELRARPGLGARLPTEWVRLERDLELPAGVHRAKVAVRDAGSGRLGSAALRVLVPETGAFRMSTPILSDAAESDPEGWPRPAPTGSREFASGRAVYLALDVYGAALDPSSRRPSVAIAYDLVRGDAPAPRLAATPMSENAEGTLHRFVAFELAGVVPGPHRIVGRIVDETTGRELAFSEPFTVTPAEDEKAASPSPPRPRDPELVALLERAGRYVVDYEQAFHDIAADEEYSQRSLGGDLGVPDWRRTRADVVFVRLAPPIPWGCFRDVYEVNGAPIRDREARLERLFRDDPGSAVERAEAILAESARYNIGPERTVNMPTLPLLFLHPQNQARFEFAAQATRGASPDGVEVTFRETTRPTIVREFVTSTLRRDRGRPASDRGSDLTAEGRFRIDARRGTVLRSEVRFRFSGDALATIATVYRAEPRLAMWVPAEMRERYVGGGFGGGTDCFARYSGFRRFEVTVEEGDVRLPPP